jgi:RNA polymerase sigma-70 factor (ECF subfamily)
VTLSQAKEEPMHQPDEGDAEIIARSLRRPDRFATIFDRHATHIRRYLARRLGGHVADDLVAETFVVAFGKRAGYDQTRPDARPWLYGIATNLLRKHHRDEAREYRLRASIAPNRTRPGTPTGSPRGSRPRPCTGCWPWRSPNCPPGTATCCC